MPVEVVVRIKPDVLDMVLRVTAARRFLAPDETCLLYTSDAADERSSVDLGGRRIIKKKKKMIYYDSSHS